MSVGSSASEMDGSRGAVRPSVHAPERCVSQPFACFIFLSSLSGHVIENMIIIEVLLRFITQSHSLVHAYYLLNLSFCKKKKLSQPRTFECMKVQLLLVPHVKS